MTPTPAMQRKAVGAVVAVRAIGALALLRVRLLRLLAAGNKRRQPVDILIVRGRHVLRTGLEMLGLLMLLEVLWLLMLLEVLWLLMLLRLKMLRLLMLLARIKRLRLARRKWLAAHGGLIVAIVIAVIGKIAGHLAWLLLRLLLLVIGLILSQLFLRGRDQAEVMFGVLIVVLGGDWIAGTLRIAGKLEVFLGDVGRRSPDFHVRSVRLVHTRQWILVMMTTLAVATPHALVLTVSHGLLFRQPPSFAAALLPPFQFTK
jgi:hypothetical protein